MVEVWRDQVIAVLLADNPWAKVSSLAILGACCVTGVIAFGSIHVIRTLFIKQNGRLSRQKIKERKQTLLSLTILVSYVALKRETSYCNRDGPFTISSLLFA